tara:strand:- start:220 stop:1596 length:1377 start_codon:yes stop_codon:yes gene_type:complete
MRGFILKIITTFCFLSFKLVAQNVDYEAVAKSIDADLKKEVTALSELRQEIAKERPLLAEETEKIAAELRDKRRRSQLASQERDALLYELSSLSSEVRVWRDESTYIDNLLGDFRRNFESQMSIAEAESLRPLLLSADKQTEEGFDSKLQILEKALERLTQLTSPTSNKGSALDAEGVLKDGTFIEAGPVSWFVSDDQDTAGLIVINKELRSQVISGTSSPEAIQKLADGKSSEMVFDPTMGMASVLNESDGTIYDHIMKGGKWIFPILLIGALALLAAILKWLQLLGIRTLRPARLRRVIEAVQKGDFEIAKSKLGSRSNPATKALDRAIEMKNKSPEDVEEALYEEYLRAKPKLERGLSWVAIAAATAPLLGLLGTVTGMIHTFKLINIFGTGDAKSLSSGISEALVTTEFGLVVAIPALILHALLSRKIRGILSTMEMASIAYINGLKSRHQSKS